MATQLQGETRAAGSLGMAAFVNDAQTRAARAKACRREVRRWHLRNWVRYRWMELPFYAVLMLVPLLRLFAPALRVLHSSTALRVRRARPGYRIVTDEYPGDLAAGILAIECADGLVRFTTEAVAVARGWIDVLDYGIVGRHLVVTAGKNYVASAFAGGSSVANMKFHGYGTNTTAAAAGDTTLGTELTTQYASSNTRPTGSQSSSTNVYTTVATLSPGSGGTIAVTEWGLFSQAANSGGTLYDHQVFSAVNLVAANGDSLQTTYNLTLS